MAASRWTTCRWASAGDRGRSRTGDGPGRARLIAGRTANRPPRTALSPVGFGARRAGATAGKPLRSIGPTQATPRDELASAFRSEAGCAYEDCDIGGNHRRALLGSVACRMGLRRHEKRRRRRELPERLARRREAVVDHVLDGLR